MTLAKKFDMAKAEAEIADADDAGLPPQQPSAPTLELMMEAGFFDGPTTDDHPTSDGPFTRDNGEPDRGRARMTTPLSEAAVVLVPVCEAVRTSPSPAQDEEDNAARQAGKVREVHDDWGCIVGIRVSGHLNCSGCHDGWLH